MLIIFSDSLGVITVEVDSMGVNFCDGYAYFSDKNKKEYKIKIEDIKGCFPITEG